MDDQNNPLNQPPAESPTATPSDQPIQPPNPLASPESPPFTPSPQPQPAINPLASPTDPITDTTSSTGGSNMWAIVSAIFMGILNWVIIPIGIVLILHNFVFQAFHVVGSSMVPNLKDADYLVISKIDGTVARAKNATNQNAYIPKRDEIVVFHYPKDPSLVFVKRVIGLPGERVVVKDGTVRVFNNQHPEGFDPNIGFKPSDPETLGTYDDIVPEGNVFVLGDNRTPNGSFDSREWGTLQTNLIIGRVLLRLLPLDTFRFFSYVSLHSAPFA